jgi:hypothetical protein
MAVSSNGAQVTVHAAEAAALGFYYQALFALVTLIERTTDDAAVAIERLDDIELIADGKTLLYQLKHSISVTPPPVTLASRALWKTIKVWIDVLPELTLAETTLHLVAVGSIPEDSPLRAFLEMASDRSGLVASMTEEAQRVVDARMAASHAQRKLPFGDRVDGCEAFLALAEMERDNLVCRIQIQPQSPTVGQIEDRIADHLNVLPAEHRAFVAERLVGWWDRQVIYSLCGKRSRVLTRIELQQQISSLIGDIEAERLVPDFMTVLPPDDYQPNGMLRRQIRLVEGAQSDISRAIREEWRAREQRAKWVNANIAMASKINDHDLVLQEEWSDRHTQMAEACLESDSKQKCQLGLGLLRWAHEVAPNEVPSIGNGWSAPYYVRGSYQVLAIDLKVGWHSDYRELLKDDK